MPLFDLSPIPKFPCQLGKSVPFGNFRIAQSKVFGAESNVLCHGVAGLVIVNTGTKESVLGSRGSDGQNQDALVLCLTQAGHNAVGVRAVDDDGVAAPVGFSGLVGAGRTETMRAIFGADPKETGEIILDGKPLVIRSPQDAIKQGVVLAPEDRKKEGLCTRLSIRDNIALPNLDLICGGPFGTINKKVENDMIEKGKSSLTIKMASAENEAASLSGGNQQKVVVAKWLARDSRVVIFDEPTRGIDVAAKVEIYEIINDLKKRGIAVIIVSSEMPEVMGISDRIIVMCNGKITGEVDPRNTTEEEIMTYATQFGDNAE